MNGKTEVRGKARTAVLMLAAFLSTVALSISGTFVESNRIFTMLAKEMDGVSIENVIIFAALCVFYCKMDDLPSKIRHWSVYFIAALFSVFMLIGLSFSQNGNLDFVLGSKRQFCIAALTFVGYFFLFKEAVKALYLLLDRIALKPKRTEGKKGRLRQFAERHSFACSFVIILLFWLPWLIVFLPGSVPYDGTKMLIESIGGFSLTDQHSWVLVLLMGVIYRAGSLVSDNFAVIVIVAVFVLFELICYASTCKIVHRWKLPGWVLPAMILFFSIYPYFGTYAQAIIKDSPFMAAFVLYMALYLDVCLLCRGKVAVRDPKKSIWLDFGLLLLVGYLVCILRNNGPYLVVPASLLLILVVNKGFRRFAVMLLVGACSLVYLHNNVLAPAVGVTSITDRAKLYMTFQIVGRYAQEYPDDLTEEEEDALLAVFNVEELSELGEVYNPQLVDPVKSYYRSSSTEEQINAYLDVIASMVRRHPLVCIEAFLNQSYGYYYPFHNCLVQSTYQLYIREITTDTFDGFNIHYIMPESARNLFASYANLWLKTPVLSTLVNSGTATWVFFLLAGYLTYRKNWREILVFAAPAINIVICILSPVNGYPRYAMPSLACIPLLVMWTILVTREVPNPPESAEAEEEQPPQQEALADASTGDK
ncbi:MAG: DUF6020 family protein [Clostridiales bacterium]|nr:DUF6020 family protein [Clostridiales bacterium]